MEITKKTKEELREKANRLPLSPGVYIMRGAGNKIVYVGKSRALKNRVSQYFADTAKNTKTMRMVASVWDFEYMLTDTEIEALALENKLIKLHQPKYNILLKDAKSYPYIKVTVNEDYPRVLMTRRRENDGARYFGPYSGAQTAGSVVRTVNKLFGLPNCKNEFPKDIGKVRPCLYSQIGQCCGVCTGAVTKEEYAERISEVLHILRGSYSVVRKELEEKMKTAAGNLMFEAAADYRDRISALSTLWEHQKVVGTPDLEMDVVSFCQKDACSCLSVYYVREGAVMDSDNFLFGAEQIADDSSVVSFLADLYTRREDVPKTILLDWEPDPEQLGIFEAYLSDTLGVRTQVRIPKIGELKKLCEMVRQNAELHVKQYLADRARDDSVMEKLALMLGLEVVPETIESIDISNLGKEHLTAGIIRLSDGKFDKSGYRTYKIRTVEGTDDYASMCEALTRRFSHAGDDPLPDLLLLDGGVGHVNAVLDLMEKCGVRIPVFGMVKDDYHKTRTLTDGQREINIAREQDVFVFIYKIQEEVHRYTVGRMTNAKRRQMKHSGLENIPGIGEKKARILLRTFGSMAKVSEMSAEELSRVKGINKTDAVSIEKYFCEGKNT